MIEPIVEDILSALPESGRTVDIVDALCYVLSASIVSAARGNPEFQELLLQTVQSDLREKVSGRVN